MRIHSKQSIVIGLSALIISMIWAGCTHTDNQSKKQQMKNPKHLTESELAPLPQAEPVIPVEITYDTLPEKSVTKPQPEPSKRAKTQPVAKAAYYTHRVRWSGENLSLVAKWYTGKFTNWRAIAKVNPEIKPNRIFVGNKILIPEDLLVTSEPMPKDYISGVTQRARRKPSPSKKPPQTIQGEETELFGLREYQNK